MNYQIISSGSCGNAVVIEDIILVDCGVSFKKLTPYYKELKLVLLTHIHQDHFNKTTIKRLAEERPTLRFACGNWLYNDLLECGVSYKNIDIMISKINYDYNQFIIAPINLIHDVENFGYHIFINNKKILYATDTANLDFQAKDYDLYLLEGNYSEEELEKRIEEKSINGEYVYENRVKNTHLSKEQCLSFIIENANENSVFEYLHVHKEKEVKVCD